MESLDTIADLWCDWMLSISWQLLVLIGALLLLDPLLRGRSATVRYGVWSLVLLRLLLPPTFAMPTGWGWWIDQPLAALSANTTTPSPDRAPITGQRPVPIEPSSSSAVRVLVAEPDWKGVVVRNTPPPQPTRSPSTLDIWKTWTKAKMTLPLQQSIQRTRRWMDNWTVPLFLLYCGIVCAQLGMLLSSAIQVRGWARRARVISDQAMQALLDLCRERVGVRSMVELRNSEACTTPLVVGIFQPVILIPSTLLTKFTRDELAAVLTHELQHIRRRDGAVNVLQAVLGVAYFFNPLVWIANARIRCLREDVCDEFTLLALKCGPKPYGAALLKVAETLGYAAPPLAMGVLDGQSPLRKRLVRILDPKTAKRNPWTLQAIVIPVIVGMTLLPGGSPTAASRTAQANRAPRQIAPGGQTVNSHAPPLPQINPPKLDRVPVYRGFDVSPASPVPVDPQQRQRLAQHVYFRGENDWRQDTFRYHVKIDVGTPPMHQALQGEVTYQWLAMNDDSVVMMFRPHIEDLTPTETEPTWLDPRLFDQAHAQSWSRRGLPTATDGEPIPLLQRSFASLLLPNMPIRGESQSSRQNTAQVALPTPWTKIRESRGLQMGVSPTPFGSWPGGGSWPGVPAFPQRFQPPWETTSVATVNVQRRWSSQWQEPQQDADKLRVIETIVQTGTTLLDGQPEFESRMRIESSLDPNSLLPLETSVRLDASWRSHRAAPAPNMPLSVTFRRAELRD